jgi:iron complex outermembrane receptor protein
MRLGLVASLLCLCTVSLCLADPAKAAIRKDLNVPPESLSPALQQVATTYELQVLYPTQVAKDLKTHGAVGFFTPDDALKAVLSGTGLSYKYLDAKTVTVFATTAPAGDTAAAGQDQTNTTQDNSKEAGKKSSQDFRVAQVDQAAAGSQVAKPEEKVKKAVPLEEIVVTGTRIPTSAKEGAQEVRVFTREQIDQSGQLTVSDFLNTLPNVSVAIGESSTQTNFGGTTVQLRGLPIGTTLVLINGRRVEDSGSQPNTPFFDLNNVPLSAVERIEVATDGSSAIYGSDAIAGVVNIILKQAFDGFEINAKYGTASDFNTWDTDAAFGKRWERGSVAIIASYLTRGELTNWDRSITASNDYTAFGGPNNNLPVCSPGNVFSVDGVTPLPGLGTATYAAVPAGFNGKPSIEEFKGTAGTLKECPLLNGVSLIPATHRGGILVEGAYELTPSIELFTELMYSHVHQFSYTQYQGFFGQPGFQTFTVSASNPYNPFGTTVGISEALTSLQREGSITDTEFFRPLVGARGSFLGEWKWELSGWQSRDTTDASYPLLIANNVAIQDALNSSNPATALNPFVAGPPGSQSMLQSFFSDGLVKYSARMDAVTGFARGPVFQLPAGSIQLVVGAEYDRDTLSANYVNLGPYEPAIPQTEFHRDSYALFTEARLPIVANQTTPANGDVLALTLAGRLDHYSDFGSKTTPQLGLEWRPVHGLLMRATYAAAFKAPSLFDLYTARQQTGQTPITDPTTGQTYEVTLIGGGNQNLLPETGKSRSVGFVYSDAVIPNLQLSITYWNLTEDNHTASLSPQTIVDNANLFPGRVVRAPSCSTGQSCPITEVDGTFLNFGAFEVAGIDYQLTYSHGTRFGTWTANASASEVFHYYAALVPGAPAMDGNSVAQDSGNWTPRWKGTLGFGWKLANYVASWDGRYVGRYQDYDSMRIIGNFWVFDANIRYGIGQTLTPNSWLKGAYVELGGVNIFDKVPQFSNFNGGFLGYDPAQADIRGRYLYLQVGLRL